MKEVRIDLYEEVRTLAGNSIGKIAIYYRRREKIIISGLWYRDGIEG